MFILQDFISHSGIPLEWKIECDDLTEKDINTLAFIIGKRFKFGSVRGVPTGRSMKEEYQVGDIGVVIFSRTKDYPTWITPLFEANF